VLKDPALLQSLVASPKPAEPETAAGAQLADGTPT